jgi:hypothetical protein
MDDPIRTLRHAARGYLNSIRLCASALELPCDHEEEVTFIDDIIESAQRVIDTLDELDKIRPLQDEN